MKSVFVMIILLISLGIGLIVFYHRTRPSLSKNWSPDQSLMPSIHFLNGANSNQVHIENIRDIHYRTTRDYDLSFYDRKINVSDVESAWLVISPFGPFGIAHTFVSFGFKNGTYLAISIEVRRKKAQKFSAIKGFFNQFEMMYVLADERDVIKVRTNVIKATVRLFPIHAEKKRIQAVFLDMLKRADKLGREPEFYNTVWNNCTTNIIMHTRKFTDKSIPFWDIRYIFPERLDKIVYDLGMLDTDLPYKKIREYFDITEIAQATGDSDDFSKNIRAKM